MEHFKTVSMCEHMIFGTCQSWDVVLNSGTRSRTFTCYQLWRTFFVDSNTVFKLVEYC